METNPAQIFWLLILGLMIFVVDFLACVYMCVCACMCMVGWGRRCVQMHVKVRQDLDVWSPFQSLLTLFTEVGSLTDPRAHRHELALQIISASQGLRLQVGHQFCLAFEWDLGI